MPRIKSRLKEPVRVGHTNIDLLQKISYIERTQLVATFELIRLPTKIVLSTVKAKKNIYSVYCLD